MKKIHTYAILPNTRTLGPFNRFAIWTQGCPRKCEGCMTPDAQPIDGGKAMCINSLSERIRCTYDIEGVTISGGEPFIQAKALAQLIKSVKIGRDFGIIVYTGYTLRELYHLIEVENDTTIKQFLDQIDILIDGSYIKHLDDGLSLRGSSNQSIHLLTDRYAEIAEQYYKKKERKVEIHLLRDQVFLAGVPGSEMLKSWQNQKLKI